MSPFEGTHTGPISTCERFRTDIDIYLKVVIGVAGWVTVIATQNLSMFVYEHNPSEEPFAIFVPSAFGLKGGSVRGSSMMHCLKRQLNVRT
jgi:hypothetical protein